MKRPEFTKGKELREEDHYRSSLEEVQERFRCCDERDVDSVLENVNAELEEHGLEIVIGKAPDTNVWIRIEEMQMKRTTISELLRDAQDLYDGIYRYQNIPQTEIAKADLELKLKKIEELTGQKVEANEDGVLEYVGEEGE